MAYVVSRHPTSATNWICGERRPVKGPGRRVRADKVVYVEFKDGTSAIGPAGRFDWRDPEYGPVVWAALYEDRKEL